MVFKCLTKKVLNQVKTAFCVVIVEQKFTLLTAKEFSAKQRSIFSPTQKIALAIKQK